MPGSAKTTNNANAMMIMTNPKGRTSAKQALNAASTTREAVSLANLIDDLDPAMRDEVHTVLDALPHSVDQALLTGLRSALDRDIEIEVGWKEGSPVAVLIEESAGNAKLRIELVTPHGREYTDKK